MQLRDYQAEATKATIDSLINHTGNPIVEMATGLGKSICIADLCREARLLWGGNIKVLVLTHRAKLVEQDAAKFLALGVIPCVYCAELGRKEIGQFTIGTILSVKNAIDQFADYNLVIVDECQMISNKDEGTYREVLKKLPRAKVVGYTATPFRLKGGACYGEGRMFSHRCFRMGFGEGVRRGFLTPPINYDAGWDDNFDDIRITAGDFNQKDMNAHFNKVVHKSCIDLVHRMKDRHYVLVFACSIVHAESIVECLTQMGEGAKVYHSEMSLAEDKMVINSFQSRQFKYLVSIDKLGVGFDAPFVDGLGLMRPTMSRGLAIQMLGRGSRLFDNKPNFLVADYAGNIRRHNLLDPDAYDVPYEKIEKPKRTGGTAPIKTCPNCQMVCATRVNICSCGYKFPPKIEVAPDAGKQEFTTPITIWIPELKKNEKHSYVCLTLGSMINAYPIYFFPEDAGYARTKSMLLWNKLFGGHFPTKATEMVAKLQELEGTITEATFVKNGKFFEIKDVK